MQVGRVGVGCEQMVVCHKEITFGLLLKPYKIFQSSEIAPQVQVACRTHSADYGFHVAKLVNLPEVAELEGKKTNRLFAFAKGNVVILLLQTYRPAGSWQ